MKTKSFGNSPLSSLLDGVKRPIDVCISQTHSRLPSTDNSLFISGGKMATSLTLIYEHLIEENLTLPML